MLKVRRGTSVCLITQPAHAELAGYLAAHWGNEEFARPGSYAASADAERLRREVIFAVAEHDNGWWEWESDPAIAPEDGLPAGLGEVLKDPVAGMHRWLLGIPRHAERHPYASLLISDHAHWLYAAQFEADAPAEFRHHLQRQRRRYPAELEARARTFLAEIARMQKDLVGRASTDPLWREALEPEMRYPHARLVQTLDALSLGLCSDVLEPEHGEARGLGEDHLAFDHVPRRGWLDRVTIDFTPRGDGRIAVDPYPFDQTPLPVAVAARVVEPHQEWRAVPAGLKRFTLIRR